MVDRRRGREPGIPWRDVCGQILPLAMANAWPREQAGTEPPYSAAYGVEGEV